MRCWPALGGVSQSLHKFKVYLPAHGLRSNTSESVLLGKAQLDQRLCRNRKAASHVGTCSFELRRRSETPNDELCLPRRTINVIRKTFNVVSLFATHTAAHEQHSPKHE